jgi:hypothetical protein
MSWRSALSPVRNLRCLTSASVQSGLDDDVDERAHCERRELALTVDDRDGRLRADVVGEDAH